MAKNTIGQAWSKLRNPAEKKEKSVLNGVYYSKRGFIIETTKKELSSITFDSEGGTGMGVVVLGSHVYDSKLSDEPIRNLESYYLADFEQKFGSSGETILDFGDGSELIFDRNGENIEIRARVFPDPRRKPTTLLSLRRPTALQVWKSANPDVKYINVQLSGLKDYVNPLQHLSYVYHDGVFVETFPMFTYILVPSTKLNYVDQLLTEMGVGHKVMN